MAVAENIQARFISKQRQLGRAALHSLYPKDIEFYFLALQLVDSQNNTVDYFSWPVLPDELREVQVEATNVRKTIGGVYVLKNSTFVPTQISLRGDFGRNFKILVNDQKVELAGFGFSIKNGKFNVDKPNFLGQTIPQFSSFAKTGYGCIKMIQSIRDKSRQLDQNNKPYSLYFYNPILGDNYQVEIIRFEHMQDKDTYNMRPAYNLQLTSVASLDNLLSQTTNIKSAIKNLSFSSLQKSANNIANNLRSVL